MTAHVFPYLLILSLYSAMIGENRLSLRNNRLKFKTAGKLPIILEEFIEYTPV